MSLTKPDGGWPLSEELAASPKREAFDTWLDALATWNEKMDLTAAKDADELVWLMCGDAARLAPLLPKDASLVDVGTGAGAPGLALALLRPDLRVTVTETLGKRASFLRSTIGTLGLESSVLLETGDLTTGDFDVAVSRATFSPEEWLERGTKLVKDGGDVWLFLAKEAAPPGASQTIDYTGPLGAGRRLVRYRRTA